MTGPKSDPYELLGVSRGASDAEVRAAYRRLVQLHHPDHNGGSAAAARRFEEVQAAYAQIRADRAQAPRAQAQRTKAPRTQPSSPRPSADPNLEARLADLDGRVKDARARAERAMRTARAEAGSRIKSKRPSDDELGYVRTDDSFGKIFDELIAKLTGEDPRD